ncbi:ABC transporter permease [Stomatohabitans albus]|uniref:ABC transporter permease n=1 Tax=Stomatohabitans albus TaxID=3110766 RepID=UPI00300D6966
MKSSVFTVTQFELTRTLKKKSFWILTILLPLMIAGFGILGSLGGKSASEAISIGKSEEFSFVYQDDSNIIVESIAKEYGGTPVDSIESSISSVKDNAIDAAIHVPANPLKDKIVVVAKERGLFSNSAYYTIVDDLLKDSATDRINNKDYLSIIKSHLDITLTTYKNGEIAGEFRDIIAPGVFLILFYFSIVLLGNQMVNATVEEKENRVTEMVLISMDPMHLLLGKVLGLLLLGIVQVVTLVTVVLLMAIGATLWFGGGPNVANTSVDTVQALSQFSFGNIPIDPVRTILAIGLFFAAFLMTSGLLTMSGSMVGNAKDAGQVFGFVVMGLMLPYAALLLIVNEPESLVTAILTWFPLTSPVTVMIRNAVDNMDPIQVGLALLMQLAIGGIFFRVGARLFGAGALAYQGMSVKQALATLRGR